MEGFLCFIVRTILGVIQRLPLRWVARLGRAAGNLAYVIDIPHRRVARQNLKLCFGKELDDRTIRDLARENFRRLGENYICAIRTAVMSDEEIGNILTVRGDEKIRERLAAGSGSCVIAIGHFGNFELYARANMNLTALQFATTYRALRQPALNRVFQDLRERSRCLYFERRLEGVALKEAIRRGKLILGLLSDQHASGRGLCLPFLGQDCSTTPAPSLYALRYGMPLFTAVCYRIQLGVWRIEIGDEIPTYEGGQPRTLSAITADINKALEVGVRRDPANWFWVHKRWKPKKIKPGRPTRR